MNKHILKIFLFILFAILICLFYKKYSEPKLNTSLSPVLIKTEVYGENRNSMDTQTINIILKYDKPVWLDKNIQRDIKITIAGNRISSDKYKIQRAEDNNQEIKIEIEVTSVTNARLIIEPLNKSGQTKYIRSQDKKYLTLTPKIDCLIPSGVTLDTVNQVIDNGQSKSSIIKSVKSVWNIRSIAWIRLLKDDKPVPFKEENTSDVLDGAFALHGHDFLHETNKTVATKIGELLEKYYGDKYLISVNGDQIKVESKVHEEGSKLDLQVYLY